MKKLFTLVLLITSITFLFGCEKVAIPTDDPVSKDPVIQTIVEVSNGTVGNEYITGGTVTGLTETGILFYDETGYMYIYQGISPTVSVGDIIQVKGTTALYGGAVQFTSTSIVSVVNSGTYTESRLKTELSASEITALTSDFTVGAYVEVEGTLTQNGGFYNVSISDSDVMISIQSNNATSTLSSSVNKDVTVTGYVLFVSGTTTKYINILLTTFSEVVVIDYPDDIVTITEVKAGDAGETYKTAGVIAAVSGSGLLITRQNDFLYLDTMAIAMGMQFYVGDTVQTEGITTLHGGTIQLTSSTLALVSNDTYTEPRTPIELNGAGIDSLASSFTVGHYISCSGVVSNDGSNVTLNIEGTDVVVVLLQRDNVSTWTKLEDKLVTVSGYVVYVTGTTTTYLNIMVTDYVEETMDGIVTFDEIIDYEFLAGEFNSIDWDTFVLNASSTVSDQLTIEVVMDTIDYNVPGTYTVTVQVRDEFGNEKTQSFTITILSGDVSDISDVITGTVGINYTVEGMVVSISNHGLLLTNQTEYLFVYTSEKPNVEAGDTVHVEGVSSLYGGAIQLAASSVTFVSVGTYDETRTPLVYTGTEIDGTKSSFTVGEYIRCNGTLSMNGTYVNLLFNDSNVVGSMQNDYDVMQWGSYDGSEITITGYVLYVNGSSTSYLNIMITDITDANTVPSVTFDTINDQTIVIGEQTAIDWTTYITNASSNVSSTLTTSVVSNTVDYNVLGTYTVTVKVVDSLQNEKTQTFNVTVAAVPIDEFADLTILTVNDLHGYILQDDDGTGGISNMAYLMDQIRAENNNVVLIGNGDMFQGTAVSNMTHGLAVIEVMNMMEFDAMGIGNHEFDWGIEEVLKYFDGDDTNGEADFPLLNANVYLVSDGSLLTIINGNMFEYTIVDKGNIQVGIISYVGDVYNSISQDKVADFYFDLEIATSVTSIATTLKSLGADIIVVNIHDADSGFNSNIASLTDGNGDYLVDVVINGHAHSVNTTEISRSNGTPLLVVQAGANGNAFGQIDLTIELNTMTITNYSIDVVYVDSAGDDCDTEIEAYIDSVVAGLDNTVLAIAGETITSTSNLFEWSSNVMLAATNADVAFSNNGGIRSTGGIIEGTSVTVSQLYEISPFDNTIWLMELTKSEFESLMNTGSLYYEIADGVTLNSSDTYTIAVISYVYFWPQLDSLRSSDDINTNLYIRDLLITDITLKGENNELFSPISNSEASITNQLNTYPQGRKAIAIITEPFKFNDVV